MSTMDDPIEISNFKFKNSEVRITVNRSQPEIKLGGITVGPFEEGREYRVKFWIAQELSRAGIVNIKDEDMINAVKLYKIHWTERVQPVKRISSLTEHFYPLLRFRISQLRSEAMKKPEKLRDYENFVKLSQDILNSRLKKIILLASSTEKTAGITQNLTIEEKWLYERLTKIIEHWRRRILSLGEER